MSRFKFKSSGIRIADDDGKRRADEDGNGGWCNNRISEYKQ